MSYTPQQIGTLIRETRKTMGATQKNLALTSGTGLRFILDLESGKETCSGEDEIAYGAYARCRIHFYKRGSP